MSSTMRTTLQTVPESLATDHVTNSKVRIVANLEFKKNIYKYIILILVQKVVDNKYLRDQKML